MADVAQTALPQPGANTEDGTVFSGTPRNLATGIALILGGGLSFTMGMTNVFFASAVAWVFVAWGVLFIYNALIEMYQTYKVTDEALIVDTPWRPVERHKVFDWGHLHRVDIFVKRNEPKPEDIVMQVYHTPAGDTVLDREDRRFDPQLAQLILDRAKLKSTDAAVSNDMSQLPKVKGHYIWNQSGKAPVAG
ncbi:MAG: hypothetical protein U0175_26155 [Caldilineaceae bacterium]